jgi:hypothetical protein
LSARCALTESRFDSGKLRRDNGNFRLSGARSAQGQESTKCRRDQDCEVQGARSRISFEEISKSEVTKPEFHLDCRSRGGYVSVYHSFQRRSYLEERGSATSKVIEV